MNGVPILPRSRSTPARSCFDHPPSTVFRSRFARFAVIIAMFGLHGSWAAPAATPIPSFKATRLAEIVSTITNAIGQEQVPGAVYWLERQGLSYEVSLGRRAIVPQDEAMTSDTIFDIASLTKVVATTPSVLLLIERGRIKLDGRVRDYIPEFRGEGTSEITVRHLLTHTSGLRPGLPASPAWTGYEHGIALACQEKTTNAPGTVFRYSDINFILLGEIVQRTSGKKLADFAAAEIFGPLRMRDTGYLPDASLVRRIAPTEQSPEGMLRGRVHDPTARRMGGVAGHAGVFSTAADLARYARMLLNRGELDGVRIFKSETVRLMTSVQSPELVLARRGLGWDIDSPYSRPRGSVFPRGSFGHTGWTGTALWIDPFSKTFWIMLSNRVHPDGRGNSLPLYLALGTLSAQAIEGFQFANVDGALAFRTNFILAAIQPRTTATNHTPTASSNRGGVLNGIDVLVRDQFAPLKKLRVGLVTNHTGQDRWRNPTIDLLFNATNVELKALFSPEHGVRGALDEQVLDSVDEPTGLPVRSLYPKVPRRAKDQSEADYEAMALQLRSPSAAQMQDLDAVVFDLQDIGCRFYTYVATMGNCLRAAAENHKKIFVLDRVNPIGGLGIEGPIYHGAPSFVGWHALPLRHGMTVGELARMFNAERGFKADLTVIPCEGWTRNAWFDATGQPWIDPSPNMRSLEAAALYPGIGLHESALSVGRGTDRPFERIGAPYIDDLVLADSLNAAGLAGVRFYPIQFTPTYSTFSNQLCRGVAIVVTNRDALNAVDVGLEIAATLRRLYPQDYAIDKIKNLLRDPTTFDALKAGKTRAEITPLWSTDLAEFQRRRSAFLLYK